MALPRRKDIPVNIIVDTERFQSIVGEAKALIGELDAALKRVKKATDEMRLAKADLDKTIRKLETVKRRPTI